MEGDKDKKDNITLALDTEGKAKYIIRKDTKPRLQ